MCSNVLWVIMYYIQLYNKNNRFKKYYPGKGKPSNLWSIRGKVLSYFNPLLCTCTMAVTSRALVVPKLPSAAVGACVPCCVTGQGSNQGFSQALGSDQGKFIMFPRQGLFPGLGHLSNWPGSASMFLIFPLQQQELAERECPALIHLSGWSHTPSRTIFAFETFERALCSPIIKDSLK